MIILVMSIIPASYSQHPTLYEQMKTTTLLNEIICRPYSVIVINDEQIPICIDIIMAYMMGLKIEYVFTEEQNQRFIDLYTTNTTLRSQSNNQSKLINSTSDNTSLKNSHNGGTNVHLSSHNFNSSISPPFFSGTIFFDEIPTLNKTTSFKLAYGSSVNFDSNVTESIHMIKSYFEHNPQEISKYFTLYLTYPDSFNLEITNIDQNKITYQHVNDLMYANITIPNLYEKDYFTTLQYVYGTFYPTSTGYYQISLKDITGTSDTRSIIIENTKSVEHNINRARAHINTNVTLMYIPDVSQIQQEVWLQLPDEQKTKITVTDTGRITHMDPSIRTAFLESVNNIVSERKRPAVFSDRPDDTEIIYKMPKAKHLDINLNYTNRVQLGETFNLILNITSFNRTSQYEQIYTEILLGDGLELHSNNTIDSYKKRLDAKIDPISGQNVQQSIYNIVPIDYFASLKPDNNSIKLSYVINTIQKGDWMFKIVINDQIFYDNIIVE